MHELSPSSVRDNKKRQPLPREKAENDRPPVFSGLGQKHQRGVQATTSHICPLSIHHLRTVPVASYRTCLLPKITELLSHTALQTVKFRPQKVAGIRKYSHASVAVQYNRISHPRYYAQISTTAMWNSVYHLLLP